MRLQTVGGQLNSCGRVSPPTSTVSRVARYLPLKAGTFRWGSPFGPRGGTQHRGQDFEANDGTPIFAAESGTVEHIGAASGFGQWIVLKHPGGQRTVYGHMWDAGATGLSLGDSVDAGQHIAFVGSNGQSTGPHLHFEVHPGVWRAGSQVDPKPWLANALTPGGSTVSGWTGDPVWLFDVLKDDKLIDVKTMSGWDSRGHGDFKDIRGIMVHHTGGPASATSIRDGRPDLSGPLSQLHISRDGVVSVVAVGVAWHAGVGSLPWVPANMGNWHLIGIECEWPYVGGVTERQQYQHEWRRPQILALRNTCAAILRKLAFGADRVTTHKSYAGRAQGKWDPGNMSEEWLQGEIAKDLSGFKFPGEADYTPPPVNPPTPPVDKYAGILLYRGMRGPAISKLQSSLRRFFWKLEVDGVFGPKTEDAVRWYQAQPYRRPRLDVDGIVGPATAAQLRLEI